MESSIIGKFFCHNTSGITNPNLLRKLFADPVGGKFLTDNVDRLYPCLHGTGDTMKRFFCAPDAMRQHLTSNDPDPELRPFAQDPKFARTSSIGCAVTASTHRSAGIALS
jgi:hypothetical protein